MLELLRRWLGVRLLPNSFFSIVCFPQSTSAGPRPVAPGGDLHGTLCEVATASAAGKVRWPAPCYIFPSAKGSKEERDDRER